MTVVFCDLIGSSALATRLDPEELAALLVAYRERCAAAINQNGGYISRYVGDGILACFGYPRAIGRDTHAAVTAGLAIAKEIGALARSTSLPGGADLAVRIGVETGMVVAGRLGNRNVMELDALVGTAPNTAARLQQLAPPNGVVIGEATHELVTESFEFEELAPSPSVPCRAFLVRTELPRSEKRAVFLRRRVPLVGRDAELALIRERWARASRGKGQTILLSGEAGIGKSRLAQELLDLVANERPRVVVLGCTPAAAGMAFYPAIDALRRTLAATVEKGEEVISEEALAALVDRVGLSRGPTLAVLAHALGLAPDSPDLAPTARRRILLHALQTWLLYHASDRPLLVMAEDLHWSDPSLLELLREVIDVLPGMPAMLFATYRSDFVLPWPDRTTTLRLTLPPLDRPEAERLLHALDHDARSHEAILTRADGVPLFIEEFALAAETAGMPRTLQQLFTARLDGLGTAKRLAQCAAILAPQLEPDLLGSLASLSPVLLQERIATLVASEVLVPGGTLPGAGSYMFRHALLQQAASESLLSADRRTLHARAAVVLAELRPRLALQHPEVLAEHHVAGGEFASAVPYYVSAARRALAAAALEEAETQVRRGLSAVAELPPAEVPERELDLRVLLGHVLIARRGYANVSVQEAFETALGATERVREPARSLPALRGLASFYQVRGPLSRAEMICDRLVSVAQNTADNFSLVDAWRRRGWNRGCMGRLVEAEDDLTRALNAFDETQLEEHVATAGHDPRVLGLSNLCWLAPSRYGVEIAAQRAEVAAAAALNSPHSVSRCYGLVFAALVFQRAERFDEALSLANRALEIAHEKGFAYWVAMGRVAIGYDQIIRRTDVAAGRETIRHGLSGYRETQGELLRPYILLLLSEAEEVSGEIDAARATMDEAINVACSLEAHGFLPELLVRRAHLCSATLHSERRSLLDRALADAKTQGAEAVATAASCEISLMRT
jgi:class 3 adenylate cyclase/tetratricopeptide (TPR) repeat protein